MSQELKTFIDGNSVGFLAHQAGMKLKAGDQETQAVFHSLRIIRSICQKYRADKKLVLWDGRSWRKDEIDTYKATRTATEAQRKDREGYKSQTPYIRRALHSLGIPQAFAFNLEADDLAAMLTERAVKQGTKVRLITRDRDWQQMVQQGVTWHDHKTHARVSVKTFEEETGYPNRHVFSEAKALAGDASDNIKGIGGIGPGRAKLLFEHWPRVADFLADPNPNETAGVKLPKALLDFHSDPLKHEAFKHNFYLMDLTQPWNLPEPDGLKVDKGDFDKKAFAQVCKELGFHSILEKLNDFVQPFEPIGELV